MHSIIPYEVLTEQLYYRTDTLHHQGGTQRVAMRKENTYLPSARKTFQRYERVSHQENILLVGTVGAGKSATINTITAALSGEKKYRAPIGALLSPADGQRKRTSTHLMW